MDEELRRLIALADRYARTGERLGLVFARELAVIWRDVERALARLLIRASRGNEAAAAAAVRAIALKAQVSQILTTEGYDTLVTAATRTATDEMLAAGLSLRAVADVAALQASAGPLLDALREIARIDLLAVGDETATALWRSLAQHVLTTRPIPEIVEDLSDVLDRHEAEIQTLYDTQVAIFGRQVEAHATEDLGDAQPFLFVGPIDDKTRPFCLELVGQVLSRAAIDDLDNGQLPNPFLTGGGWNCRHSWLAVESQELREMTDTGDQIDPIASDVQRAKARRAARKKQAA